MESEGVQEVQEVKLSLTVFSPLRSDGPGLVSGQSSQSRKWTVGSARGGREHATSPRLQPSGTTSSDEISSTQPPVRWRSQTERLEDNNKYDCALLRRIIILC